MDGHVQTITNAVGILTTTLTSVEQHVSALAARMFAVETGPASASGVHAGSSRPFPGYVGASTTAGSRDPGSVDENRSMRRKLETGPDDGKLA